MLALSVLVALASCGGAKESGPEMGSAIVSEWHLTDITGVKANALPSVYVEFKADKSFEIYQKLGEGRYRKYLGTYSVSGNVLSGKYSDGEDWGSDYEASLAGENLNLKALNGSEEVCTYEKGSLSAADKSNALLVTKSEESLPRFL